MTRSWRLGLHIQQLDTLYCHVNCIRYFTFAYVDIWTYRYNLSKGLPQRMKSSTQKGQIEMNFAMQKLLYCCPLFPSVKLYYFTMADKIFLNYILLPASSTSTSTAEQKLDTFPPHYLTVLAFCVTCFGQQDVKRCKKRLRRCSGSWACPVFPSPLSYVEEELSLGSFCFLTLNSRMNYTEGT